MYHSLPTRRSSDLPQLVARGFEEETVARIERLLYVSEYKRRQAPPWVKLGTRNFGRDRRYQIGRAHLYTSDSNAHLIPPPVCEKTKQQTYTQSTHYTIQRAITTARDDKIDK